MTTIEKIQQSLPELSRSERKVADHFLKYPYDAQRLTIDTAADLIGVSRSALIRFTQKLGFSGFSEFRYNLINDSKSEKSRKTGAGETAINSYAELFQLMENSLSAECMSNAADLIIHASRVLTVGRYHSYMSAQQMAFRLNRLGIDAMSLEDSTIIDRYTNILRGGDVVIVFSISADTSYIEWLEQFRKNRVSIIIFTMAEDSPTLQAADTAVLLPSAIHFGQSYILDEAIPFFLAIEMVVGAVYSKM